MKAKPAEALILNILMPPIFHDVFRRAHGGQSASHPRQRRPSENKQPAHQKNRQHLIVNIRRRRLPTFLLSQQNRNESEAARRILSLKNAFAARLGEVTASPPASLAHHLQPIKRMYREIKLKATLVGALIFIIIKQMEASVASRRMRIKSPIVASRQRQRAGMCCERRGVCR